MTATPPGRIAGLGPLGGLTIAACLHVTAETAVLVHALRAGGARVFLAASNPLSTQDDIAAALVADGAAVVYARAGADRLTYDEHIHRALDSGPDLVVDDGGEVVVVAGYGPCGTGIAQRARGLGAQVIVTEVDPVRALDAFMQGFRVLPMAAAAPLGELFITATGSRNVIGAEHLPLLRDGAILCNAGHFDVEIDVRALADMAIEISHDVRPHTDEYLLADGRRLLLLAEGRIVNLVAAEGNPPAVMDVSFAGQALVLGWLAREHGSLLPGVHSVPPAIDDQVARLALASSGAEIDTLTPAQQEYLSSWQQT